MAGLLPILCRSRGKSFRACGCRLFNGQRVGGFMASTSAKVIKNSFFGPTVVREIIVFFFFFLDPE